MTRLLFRGSALKYLQAKGQTANDFPSSRRPGSCGERALEFRRKDYLLLFSKALSYQKLSTFVVQFMFEACAKNRRLSGS